MNSADKRPSGPVTFIQGHQLLGPERDNAVHWFISDGKSASWMRWSRACTCPQFSDCECQVPADRNDWEAA